MRIFLFVLVLALAAVVGWFLAPRARSRFGAPLAVDGRRVPDEELQRWLIYGPCRGKLEARKTRWLIEQEIERLATRSASAESADARSGASASAGAAADERELAARVAAARTRLEERCAVGDEELELEYGRTVGAFLARNPALDLEAEIGRTYRRSDWFRDELRTSLAFDKLFFPEPPDAWPDETWRVLEQEELATRDVRDLSRGSLRERFAGRDWRGMRTDEPELLSRLRETVRRRLVERAGFRTAADGLPNGIVLAADPDREGCADLRVATDELWREVEDSVEPWELAEARRCIAATHATRLALERRGVVLDPASRARVIDELRERAARADVLVEELAQREERFPSPETWVEYHVLRDAFESLERAHALPADATALAARIERSSRMHERGRVHVEVLLVAAADIRRHRWPEHGWRDAERRANELLAELGANESAWQARRAGASTPAVEPFVYWNRLLDERSDWWDPPDPRAEPGAPELARLPRNHGRFYGVGWDELRQVLNESECTDWVRGESIAAHVFFDETPGRIAGPWRCALGYVVARVAARTPPVRHLDPHAERDRELLVEDELRERFLAFTRDALRANRVDGLDD